MSDSQPFNHLLTNHTDLELSLEKSGGAAVEALPIPVRDLHAPDKCPAHALPWLAWHLSVDYWRDDWDEATQRAVCRASVSVHRKKGTLNGVREAIAATGLNAEVIFNRSRPDFVPHKFIVRVDTSDTLPTPENVTEINYQVEHVKPARCAYDLQFFSRFNVDVETYLGMHSHARQTVKPEYLNQTELLSAAPRVGVYLSHSHARQTFKPEYLTQTELLSAAPRTGARFKSHLRESNQWQQ